jgi:hypothetical protein
MEKMAKYARREDLITNTLSFKMFNKRYCDLDLFDKREYFRERKKVSRLKLQQNEGKKTI